ncbi:hypothetical protein ACQEWB_05300 [Streptomyces sp. CA-249302]|uniref:hypothetical protein n=1 Tax=Streptomyces sp. CA-249302 TaxID=3240058 RepID=UPI003D8D4CD2
MSLPSPAPAADLVLVLVGQDEDEALWGTARPDDTAALRTRADVPPMPPREEIDRLLEAGSALQ